MLVVCSEAGLDTISGQVHNLAGREVRPQIRAGPDRGHGHVDEPGGHVSARVSDSAGLSDTLAAVSGQCLADVRHGRRTETGCPTLPPRSGVGHRIGPAPTRRPQWRTPAHWSHQCVPPLSDTSMTKASSIPPDCPPPTVVSDTMSDNSTRPLASRSELTRQSIPEWTAC